MAALFTDSFDHYDFADMLGKWTQFYTSGDNVLAFSGSAGRRSTTGLRGSLSNGNLKAVSITLSPGDATFVVGFSFNLSTGSFTNFSTSTNFNPAVSGFNGDSGNALLIIRQGGTNQLAFRLNTNGTISAYRGQGSATLLGTTSEALSAGVTAYLEFEGTIHGSTGTVTVRINGATVLSLSSQNTQNTGSATWDEVVLGSLKMGAAASTVADFDDFYILDGTGSRLNDVLGDVRVDATYGNAEGNTIDFTPSTGTDNSATVDETQANGDTDYNESGTVGHKDTLAFPNAPTPGDIHFIQSVLQAKKTDAGTAGLKAVCRSNGTDYLSTEQALGSAYAFKRFMWEQNPDGPANWTESAYNAAEFGYQKSA